MPSFKADFTSILFNIMDLNNDTWLQPFEVMITLRIKDLFKFIAKGENFVNVKNLTENISTTVEELVKEFPKNHTWVLNDIDFKFLQYVRRIFIYKFLVQL